MVAARPPRDKLRVLVIEDNADGAKMLHRLLLRLGYDVRVAYTGLQGVKIAQEWLPDVVLSDIGLPELDGFEVAETLRHCPATAQAQLVAITGYGDEETLRRAKRSGYDYFFTKPVEPDSLFGLLASQEKSTTSF